MEPLLVELVECLDYLVCPAFYGGDHAMDQFTWVRHSSIFPPTLRPISGKKRPPRKERRPRSAGGGTRTRRDRRGGHVM